MNTETKNRPFVSRLKLGAIGAALLTGCWGWVPPHDERLDVPRGGAFPLAITTDGQTAWVFVFENVIRNHDQDPAAALYRIDLGTQTAAREYRIKAYETSGIIPPSVVGKLTASDGSAAFTGFGIFGFSASFIEVASTGGAMLTGIGDDTYGFGPMPLNPTLEITATPWGATWYWLRSIGNNAPFAEAGWPPVFDSGPLFERESARSLDQRVVFAQCGEDGCRVVRRDGGGLFMYGARKDDAFAVPLTSVSVIPPPQSAGLYAVCGAVDAPRLLTANEVYAVGATTITRTDLTFPRLADPGSLHCSYPNASSDYLWIAPDGAFALLDATTGTSIESTLDLAPVPQYGKRYDQTRFATVEIEAGWLVAAGVLVGTEDGNGCNRYEYCKAAFNRFATDVFFIDRKGKPAWRLALP